MTDRSRRDNQRINYQKLHSTGEKVPVQMATTEEQKTQLDQSKEGSHETEQLHTTQDIVGPQPNQHGDDLPIPKDSFVKSPISPHKPLSTTLLGIDNITMLLSEIDFCIDEINDITDEHDIKRATPEENKEVLAQLDTYRKELRIKRSTLKSLAPQKFIEVEPNIQRTFDIVKNFNVTAREHKIEVREKPSPSEEGKFARELDAMLFAADDIVTNINELKSALSIDISALDDQQLIQSKSDLTEYDNRIATIADRYERLLRFPVSNATLSTLINDIRAQYKVVKERKAKFSSTLQSIINSREVMKFKAFDESKHGIDLQKFSGFNSPIDIYSFKDDFEKILSRNTPNAVLADVLTKNYLSDPALSLVKGIQDVDTIWKRLITAYGNTKVLLTKKLAEINTLDSMSKLKDPAKIMSFLTKLITVIKDLINLAEKHSIENNLYYGDGLNNIYHLMGDTRSTRWFSSICDQNLDEKQTWKKLIDFLEKEVKVQQQRCLASNPEEIKTSKKQPPRSRGGGIHYFPQPNSPSSQPVCYFCDGRCQEPHVPTRGPGGSMVIQYFACKEFVEKSPAERLSTLWKKGLCHQCLLPGARRQDAKHKHGQCQRDFTCKHPSHHQYAVKHHVLVCEEHKSTKENEDLLALFKSRFIIKNQSLPDFSRSIQLSFFAASGEPCDDEVGIYLLQDIIINNQVFTVFYDDGCSDFVIRKAAVDKMGSYATKIFDGPLSISGIGGASTKSNHGIYQVNIPLADGQLASMNGVCLDKLTQTFPTYQLGEAESTIRDAFHGDKRYLPKLPKSIGGDVDIMIGIKYLRYHPQIVFKLVNGLSIYSSVFNSVDGSRGIVGGPHRSFAETHKQFYGHNNTTPVKLSTHLSYQMQTLLAFQDESCHLTNPIKNFEASEHAGSEITYRCVTCRECKTCKNHEQIENISIKEEVEQNLIKNSITLDIQSKVVTAKLPFINDPSIKLASNEKKAMKIYHQQIRKLNRPENITDKDDIIKSEKKMQDLGYVDYVENLPENIQKSLSNQMQHFIPWRAVWKPNSVSTPCRVVFDASSSTPTGYSLNDILAKGINSLNKLQDIALRWRIHQSAFTTDVRKMYNTIKLDVDHWCYQRYLWQENLSPNLSPKQKVIKTLIYGVRSSGNQAEHALREVARLSSSQYPETSEIILKDMYVDDCLSGDSSKQLAVKRSEEMDAVGNQGGFMLKGVVMSGEDPPETMSDDGNSVFVAGMKWWPKEDQLSLHIPQMNFSQKRRGKKSTSLINQVPDKLTRRHCVSRAGEIFDLVGLLTPITASLKLDLHELVTRKLDWDDQIPDDLRPIWLNNFELIEELGSLKFQRTIVPEDAVNLKLTTVDFADASKSSVCVSIYARFKRRCGSYSSQLVFSRSKLVPDGTTQPRAELLAALINAHTSEIVRRSFNKWHQSSTKLTDSQITLYWISNETKSLKQWVRSRVIEILRFTERKSWYHIKGEDMLADVGTRRGATLDDVNQESEWFKGSKWMKLEVKDMPIRTVSEIKMTASEEKAAQLEQYHITSISAHTTSYASKITDEVQKRLEFSRYLINPNKFRYMVVVRLLAICIKYINRLKAASKGGVQFTDEALKKPRRAILSEDEINAAKRYLYRKSSMELKHFLGLKKVKDISTKKDGIIYHTERILNMENTTVVGRFNQSMKDLKETTFVVPMMEKYSPVAIAIINEIHWYHPSVKHSGVETTLRYVNQEAFILEGRSIVKNIRKSCQRCRFLLKKTLVVAMGPVSKHVLNIAPPFFSTQVDLCGPFQCYSHHYKRTTIKIWLLVFCCSTTSTTSIKVMEDYSTQAFIQSFVRFSCDVGYPKTLLVDAGSQLVRGCQDMRFGFTDAQYQLHLNQSVNFEVCPVGGHNEHGKVERKIKEIKHSIEKSGHHTKLSIMQWETLASSIANSINNMPLVIGNSTSDLENLDIITPNRLKLGRNNDRSPTEPVTIESNPKKILEANQRIFQSWFENWLLSHVPKLIEQQKWFRTDDELSVGDIVLFLKNDSVLCSTYQYGMIVGVEKSNDGIIRRVVIKYKNSTEKAFRETKRSVRTIVVINRCNEISFLDEIQN